MGPRWRIYYGDGDTFDSSQGDPKDAPAFNVQACVSRDISPHRERFVAHKFDYYWFEDGEWFGGDIFGLFDYLARSGMVKFGRTISNDQFDRVIKAATDDYLKD